jgi:diaminopimelate decarboxylase
MPISNHFRQRLYPNLETIAKHFGTPFHIYDETGIRQTVRELKTAFSEFEFHEYFAVKANPNPRILQILQEEGCSFDCSSIPELVLARQVGASAENIMFTSNNTSQTEFEVALSNGACILNLDDISLIDRVPQMPDLICFRLNPGSDIGNAIIGKPEEAKFGVPKERYIEAYQQAEKRGAERFGLHAMVVSNERDIERHLSSINLLLEMAHHLHEKLGITVEFINIGGGLGIPYRTEDKPLNLQALVQGIHDLWQGDFLENTQLYMESGRYITGPHGVLITQAINHKESYRHYIGVDANMTALMRPGIYGAYHHIEVLGKEIDNNAQMVDVVGALCENNDKFAIQRLLPAIEDGDLLIIQDTGAHGYSMGFNYNGRLRPKELLLREDGTIELIRRAETLADYFATLNFEPQLLSTEPANKKGDSL